MVEVTALARRYKWEVNTGTFDVPVWSHVPGVVEFKLPVEPNNESDSDYDSDGWLGNTKTAQEWSLEAKVSHKMDPAGNEINSVHAFLKAASLAFDGDDIVHMRYFDRRGLADAWEGYGLIQWEPEGGETTGLDQVTITVAASSYSPALVPITNPINATPLPAISGLSPAGGSTSGGTLVIISGANFTGVTGATGVKFGATNATSYQLVSPSKLAAVAPAGSAATVRVTVTTPNGASPDTAADDYTYA
jgi:hypothetical protein